jgi:5-methylcytosine-specific restriction endonuclease McrA
MRKNWHTECVGIWFVMSDPASARRFIWKREKGICQGCGKDNWTYEDSWEVDHHKPLFEADNDISFWHPDNLRLLCSSCHKSKTKKEATRRAKRNAVSHELLDDS